MTSDVPNTDTQARSPGAIASGVPSSRYLAVPWRGMVLALTVITALFCAGVITGLSVTYARRSRRRIIDQERLNALKAQLAETPDDEQLTAAIRGEDLILRRRYFADRVVFQRGAYVLLAAGIALVLSAKWYVSFRPRGPRSGKRADLLPPPAPVTARRSLFGLAGVSALMALVLVAVILSPFDPLPPLATDNWPRFRGPTGVGVVEAGDWPLEWDAASGKNILWKCPIPGEGKSSPVIWGSRIFLTSADMENLILYVVCIDRTTGRILWTKDLKPGFEKWTQRQREDFEVMEDTGWAAPTPATDPPDPEHVFVTFATGDVACFDFAGNLLWRRNIGPPENMYGMASSLLVHEGLLLWQVDQGMDGEEGLSALLALDTKTGKTVWEADRPVPNSWTTPVIVEVDGNLELITAANPWVIAYDPEIGLELWRANVLEGDAAPSPVYADGVVFVTNEGAQAAAIRAGGSDDVSETDVLWTNEEGVPDMASPVCDGKRFLQATGTGLVTCLDAATGKLIWEHEFACGFKASPTLVGSLVYLPGDEGETYIFELADTFTLRSTARLGEAIEATPAFGDSCIYIRGNKNLFCIGQKGPQTHSPSKLGG